MELPDPDVCVMPGVPWGRFEEALTPAFWVSQAWMQAEERGRSFNLGKSLAEEVTACLLGGHGAPAEVGLAAYDRIRAALDEAGAETLPLAKIEELLTAPLMVSGRAVHYRFARQRAKYLAAALEGVRWIDERSLDDIAFRNSLCALPGIGPKTASWIVRNRRASDKVAILDVHVVRAGIHMGLFPENANPARSYVALEQRFLSFCEYTVIRASLLDAVIWATMRTIRPGFLYFEVEKPVESPDTLPLFGPGGGECQDQMVIGQPVAAEAVEVRTHVSRHAADRSIARKRMSLRH